MIMDYSKAFPLQIIGNGALQSEDKSSVSGVSNHSKRMQASVGMVKLMNLDYGPAVSPWTPDLHLLQIRAGHGVFSESGQLLDLVDLSNISQMYRAQEPNPMNRGFFGTTSLPNERKFYGKRSVILGHISKKYYSEGRKEYNCNLRFSINPAKGSRKLSELHKICQENPAKVYRKLIFFIGDLDILQLAYEFIKLNRRNSLEGVSAEILDGFSLTDLISLSQKIRGGKYKFSFVQRTWVLKFGKKKKGSLSITFFFEKIVQKAMQLVLNAIYEPIFLPESHGFRLGRNTHSVFRQIDQRFKGSNWFIEGDISRCFDGIKHEKLLKVLRRRVQCDKTIALIKSVLIAGHVELGEIWQKSVQGIPQKSVLSPLLCNIYLHELDISMKKFVEDLEKENNRWETSTYIPDFCREKEGFIKKSIFLCKKFRKISKGNFFCKDFIRVKYVRYADTFLISVLGSFRLVVKIRDFLENFLSDDLGLRLNLERGSMIKAGKKSVIFLGALIKCPKSNVKPVILAKTKRKVYTMSCINMKAPIPELIEKLISRGFARRNQRGKVLAKGLGYLQNRSHGDVLDYYNVVIREIVNYYSFVDNKVHLGSLIRILRMSCARTFALKYKLRLMSKAFKKFGGRLKCPNSDKTLDIPFTFSRTREFNTQKILSLKILEKT
uniref:Reverse transcriptase domain-containing protein n=1 Tax=Protohalopteris sp. TaxID=2843287 RepID=A0A8F0FD10_9PHAE|nr:hypothetical protein [Protohalopteris sp.]